MRLNNWVFLRINRLLRDMKYCFPDFPSPDLVKNMWSLVKLLTQFCYVQGLSSYKWKIHTCSQETNADSSYWTWVGWKQSFTFWLKLLILKKINKNTSHNYLKRRVKRKINYQCKGKLIQVFLRLFFLPQILDYNFFKQNSNQIVCL